MVWKLESCEVRNSEVEEGVGEERPSAGGEAEVEVDQMSRHWPVGIREGQTHNQQCSN